MTKHDMGKLFKSLSLFFTLLLALIMFGCEGDRGDSGTSFGTVTGVVTDTFANKVAGVAVAPTPTAPGLPTTTTDTNGAYSLTLPNGNYTLTFTRAGYAVQTQQITIIATVTTTRNVTLTPNARAALNVANASFDPASGTANFTASAAAFDPALQGQPIAFSFKDAAGNLIPATTTTATSATFTVTRPGAAAFKAAVSELAKVRQSIYPPGHDPLADQNDFDVPDFETLDRLQVLPIAQQAFENAANTPFKVFAQFGASAPFTTFSSATIATVPTNTLPFVPNGGIRNVPVGQPVVLQGKAAGPYNWTLVAPVGSSVTVLVDPTSRFPHFIPDAPGTYAVTETVSGISINIYAAKYVGMLAPAPNDDPLGVIDTACSNAVCHPGSAAFSSPFKTVLAPGVTPPQFFSTTPINSVFSDWDKSGHRRIMVRGMSEGSFYFINGCAKCHSVGFSQFSSAIKSDGFKDVANASGFTDAAWRANAPKFFAGPAGRFDQVLRKSEVQCETCHGPNGDGGAHGTGNQDAIAARFSLASDVCGVCHGEPLRHGRYQEWRASGHGDFQTAMLHLGTSCEGCHSAQGFPLLLAQLQGTNGNTANPNRTITGANATALAFLNANNVQPQTCAVCHPVHNPGSESGLVGAIVILRGDYQSGGAFDGTTPLLPAGFQANGVGMGALCITCHNSRNGGAGATATLHEDADPNFGTLAAYSAPHEACQGDVLMGHNAYFFGDPLVDTHGPGTLKALPAQLGQRSRHSLLPDTCVTCHMQKTPTDPNFGYAPGDPAAGTNHTFNIVTDRTRPAADQINALCSQCHGGFDGTGVQKSFDVQFKQLLIAAQNALLRIKFGSAAAIPAGSKLVLISGRTPAVSFTNGSAAPVTQTLTAFLASAPGTANTGPIPANGFQIDIAKANWNISLVAPKYDATQLDGTSYDNGTPIATSATVTSVEVVGDQSKAVHNPSFVNNVINTTTIRLNSL
jgi:hypothetical protein